MNLYQLATTAQHKMITIKWFTRHPLQYAEYKKDREGREWILHDNTGLKGIAAQFAKDQLETLPTSDAGKFITHFDLGKGQESSQYEKQLPDCTHIVHAVGFTREKLPDISCDGVPIDRVEFDHCTGCFVDGTSGRVIQGLHGAGIAFPELIITDFEKSFNVGLAKFMAFLQRVVPSWVA